MESKSVTPVPPLQCSTPITQDTDVEDDTTVTTMDRPVNESVSELFSSVSRPASVADGCASRYVAELGIDHVSDSELTDSYLLSSPQTPSTSSNSAATKLASQSLKKQKVVAADGNSSTTSTPRTIEDTQSNRCKGTPMTKQSDLANSSSMQQCRANQIVIPKAATAAADTGKSVQVVNTECVFMWFAVFTSNL